MDKQKNNPKKLTLYIEEEIIKKLKHTAIERSISASQLVEELIKKNL